MANEQYEIYEEGTAAALAELLTGKLNDVRTGLAPNLIAGAAESITGGGPTDTAAWTYRACPGTDGPATIESIHGNTVVESGELLSVQMEGIETVGFNQWDEEWEVGGLDDNGAPASASDRIRSKNFIPAIGGAAYFYVNSASVSNNYANVYFYDAGYECLGHDGVYSPTSTANPSYHNPFTVPQGTRYMKFVISPTYGPVYHNDICINLSDPLRNGEYEPYWKSERTIPATDLRSAGTAYDELTRYEAVTRIGVLDLGTLVWEKQTSSSDVYFRAYGEQIQDIAPATAANIPANIKCAKYSTGPSTGLIAFGDKSIARNSSTGGNSALYVYDTSYTEVDAFESAMSGVMLYYALATPTTQPIDPPLNFTYKAAAGGTERVLHTDPTAAPTLVVTYGSTADGIRDRALACIAHIENGKASANYGVGSYLIHSGTLCRVTTAIATGEAITIGTNVTATTVMAEVIALTQ